MLYEMPDKITLLRDDYATYYAYRKAIKEYRYAQYIIRNVYGGVICFRYFNDYQVWQNQK